MIEFIDRFTSSQLYFKDWIDFRGAGSSARKTNIMRGPFLREKAWTFPSGRTLILR
jgi:hypothetical protein